MKKKKLLLYSVIILVFCLFWVCYMGILRQVVDRSIQMNLEEDMQNMQMQLDKNLELQMKELQLYIVDAKSYLDRAHTIQEIVGQLNKMQPDRHYFYGEENGVIYDVNGAAQAYRLPETAIKNLERQGYCVSGLVNAADTQGEYVFFVTNYADSYSRYFVIEQWSRPDFIKAVIDNIGVSMDYMALFNEWGALVQQVMPSENQTVIYSVQSGATDYVSRERSSVNKVETGKTYNLYIPLSQMPGWFMGAQINAERSMPLYPSLIQVSLLAFAIWLLLIATVIILDIYNDKEKSKEAQKLASMDLLTKLHNSQGMESAIMGFFEKHPMNQYSLVYMDIIGFHRFNVMFGHVIGDALLLTVSQVINQHYYCGTRLSDDVFAFLAESQTYSSRDTEHRVNELVERELGKQYNQMLGFRFGVYPILTPDCNFRDIYDGALLALRDAKMLNHNHEVVYDNQVQQSADLRRNIEINMLHAFSKEEFLLYIQPKFDIATETCCGGEALVRWDSEQMGFMPPDQFIPLFEKNGFIVELDLYMLQKTMEMIESQLAQGKNAHPISVNQSRVTITFPNYLERLENLVKKFAHIPLQYIEIEITETALEEDKESVIALIHKIKEIGFPVSMDDFGAGYSSLNTLRELPVDVLKIDRAFLQESEESGRGTKIIKNIIVMSKELDMKVVCEGVETVYQLAFLRNVNCDIAQGYHFSKPIPCTEYEQQYVK